MSKRNLILIIIIFLALVAGATTFYYFYQPKSKVDEQVQDVNFLADFFPFGDKKSENETQDQKSPVDVSGFEPEQVEEKSDARLQKVSSFPIAGFGVFMKERFKEIPSPIEQKSESAALGEKAIKKTTKPVSPPTEFYPAVRYVDRATGNIFQTFADSIDERRFSQTIIPRVHEAYFDKKAESVAMRYLKEDKKTIETFLGNLPKEFLGADSAGTNEIKGSFLPENISDMSVSPDDSKMFYLFNTGESAVGITIATTTNTKVQVFNFPFTEWLSEWSNSRTITLTTKPSANVPGFMYGINPEKKDLTRILGDINGLTTLTSKDGKAVLYADNNLNLKIFSIESGNINTLSIRTLPEKCTWDKDSDFIYCAVPKSINSEAYPDSWYQGEVSFSDEIWKIDAKNGNTTRIIDLLLED
ncbi:MAG: hypothetical protein AAB873_02900, partial [Patescibacteria group bacterium]